MPIYLGNKKIKLYKGNQKVKKVYLGNRLVYSAGAIVTYHVDSGVAYAEEVDEGASCLSPKTFTPTKSGWEFLGWREDTAASENVLGSKVMGDSPITLYAAFRQAVTVTYYDTSTAAHTSTGYRYYNNGNVTNPSFTMNIAALSGWTADCWINSAGQLAYQNGATFTRDSSVTIYAQYKQNITVTYYDGGTTAATSTKGRYYAPGLNQVWNPSFTITQKALSGWSARGWSTSTAGNGAITYNNATAFTRDSNVTLYGMYQQTITVTYYNGNTTASTTTGTRYYNSGKNVYVNPSFTLTQAALSGWTARGWSTGTAGNSGITYNNATAFTRDSNITLYGMYQQSITVTYYNGSTTASTTTGIRYYNPGSGAIVNPSFTLSQAALSGWTARGWSTGTAGNAGITYSNGVAFTRDSNITLYGMYYQTITLSYNGNGSTSGSTASQTGTRYYNSNGNTVNPSFTLSANGFSKTDYNFSKWALNSASGTQYAAGASVTLSANTTMYAVWTHVSNPFYIVQNSAWVTTPYVGLDLVRGDNVVYLTRTYGNGAYGGTVYGANEDEDFNSSFDGATTSIDTKGNAYVRIVIGGFSSRGGYVTVNGKKVTTAGTAIFNIIGLKSVKIEFGAGIYALSGAPYVAFNEIYFY